MASRRSTRKKASAHGKARSQRTTGKPKARSGKPKTAKAKTSTARKKSARPATRKGVGKTKRESAAQVLPIDPVREALARLRRRQLSP